MDHHIRKLDTYLESVPVFPLNRVVFFPFSTLPLHIFEPRYREMIADAIETGSPIVMAKQKHPAEGEAPAELEDIAGAGFISNYEKLPDGRYILELRGAARVRLETETTASNDRLYRTFNCSRVQEKLLIGRCEDELITLQQYALALAAFHQAAASFISKVIQESASPNEVADIVSDAVINDIDLRQQLLNEPRVDRRLAELNRRLSEIIARSAPETSGGLN